MASCLGEQVRPAPATRLPVRRPLRIGACPHVPQLLAARDALLGDEALEHQLAGRDDGPRVLLARQPHLLDEVEQAGHDAESLEHRLGALIGGDLERTTRSEEHTSELQSLAYLVCRLLLEKKKKLK